MKEKWFTLSKTKIFGQVKTGSTCGQIRCGSDDDFCLWRVENIVGKGKEVCYQHFLLLPLCF